MAKEEIADFDQFLLLSHCFQDAFRGPNSSYTDTCMLIEKLRYFINDVTEVI